VCKLQKMEAKGMMFWRIHVLTFTQCIYDETARICTYCRSRGLTNCEILEPSKYWGSQALTESPVFNDIVEGLNLAHQRFEWIKIPPSSATTLDDMIEIVNQQSPGQEDNTNEDDFRSFPEPPNAMVSMDTVEGMNPAHQGLGWDEGSSGDPWEILEQLLRDQASPSQEDDTRGADLKRFVEQTVSIVCDKFSDVEIGDIRSMVEEEVEERRGEIIAIEDAELRLAREENPIPRFSWLDPPSTYTPDSLQRSETIPDAHSTTTNSAVVDLQSMVWPTSILKFDDVPF